jgi:hypothetical protein
MEDRWNELAAALESSDPDQVNDAIDEIKSMDPDARVRLLSICFDDMSRLYAESEDGYVRQSVVRTAKQLTLGVVAPFVLDDDSSDVTFDRLHDQTDALCGFFLEAMTDDDGRVRQSAKRGLKDGFRTYDSLDDEETIKALMVELEEMAEEYSGTRRKHLLEAKEDAEFFLQSAFGRIAEGFQKEFGDSPDR